MNEVDPRFARWFGRNVVLFARADDNSAAEKIRKKAFEFRIHVKEQLKVLLLRTWAYFCIIASTFCVFYAIVVQIVIISIFLFLPIILFIPLISIPCQYLQNDTFRDICPAESIIFFHKNETIKIEPEYLHMFYATMYLYADILNFVLKIFRIFGDSEQICGLINQYHIW